MATNPLPPQAYTKETLTQAFAWLQSQGPNIRELATTPDILVSLYLKAKLNGEAALWPSVQNFKSELKSLAGMMGEFESAGLISGSPTVANTTPSPVAAQTPIPPASKPSTSVPAPAIPAAGAVSAQFREERREASSGLAIDAKSLALLSEVKTEFNLSSEQEALRLLLAIGYKKLKSI